jgi:hypothetical protein
VVCPILVAGSIHSIGAQDPRDGRHAPEGLSHCSLPPISVPCSAKALSPPDHMRGTNRRDINFKSTAPHGSFCEAKPLERGARMGQDGPPRSGRAGIAISRYVSCTPPFLRLGFAGCTSRAAYGIGLRRKVAVRESRNGAAAAFSGRPARRSPGGAQREPPESALRRLCRTCLSRARGRRSRRGRRRSPSRTPTAGSPVPAPPRG